MAPPELLYTLRTCYEKDIERYRAMIAHYEKVRAIQYMEDFGEGNLPYHPSTTVLDQVIRDYGKMLRECHLMLGNVKGLIQRWELEDDATSPMSSLAGQKRKTMA